MIAIRLQGGLGNQMFQYAYGRELVSRGYGVVYEDSSFATDSLRDYELDVWRVDAPKLSAADRVLLPRRFEGQGWANWLQGKRPLRKLSERPLGFHQRFLTPPTHAYLTGYWQSERFFPRVRDELVDAFRPAKSVSEESRHVAALVETTNAVAIHVRRTDFLTLSAHQGCGVAYYERCVSDLLNHFAELEVFVFSDDLAWCEANLRFRCPTRFVGHNSGPTAYEDLWLMSRCRHHVIPNSTFSWWSAWLKTDPSGVTYAPAPWFNDPAAPGGDVTPDRWIAIQRQETPKLAA